MAYILSIQTATEVCSIAIYNDNKLLAEQSLLIQKSHSSQLVPSIRHLLEFSGLQLDKLSAVAISRGPGSYTGLRIGTSTAKGLCHALEIPLISVGTLKALALDVAPFYSNKLLCPMIDARRMEVYCALYTVRLEEIVPVRPRVIDESSFSDILTDKCIVFFGNGSAKCQKVIGHPNALFVKGVFNSARSIGILAYQKFLAQDFEDLAYFEPFYLKEFRVTKPKPKA